MEIRQSSLPIDQTINDSVLIGKKVMDKDVTNIEGKKLGMVKEARRIGPANEFVSFIIE